jgi:acetoacetyl-CoA synthetase
LVTSGLHFDLRAADRFFWYSTTNWIMWNIQVMGLLVGATICLYDGAVTGSNPQADWSALWRFVSERRVTFFGSGAAYFAGCAKEELRPLETTDLAALTTIGSTGSPLSDTSYRWIYDSVKSDVWLTSAAGGTEIAGAFVGGLPTLPVHVGEMQCRSLGAAVYAYDDDGKPVFDKVGELVCVKPMPSMPLYFWNDPGNRRYLDSYFDTFVGPQGERIWRHGDWLQLRSRPDAFGAVIYGRSDATINRHGLRMGTSEFYRVVESHPEVIDSIIIDLEYLGHPSYLGLFVVLQPGSLLTAGLKIELKKRIGAELSPRYVPDDVLQIPEVPRTLTGKKLEVPLKRLLLGQPAKTVLKSGAIANPDSLDWFLTFSASRNPRTN